MTGWNKNIESICRALVFIPAMVMVGISFFASIALCNESKQAEWAKSKPKEITVQGESKDTSEYIEEFSKIESAYTRVIKHYNSSLTEGQALKIARLILYYSEKFELDPRLVVSVIVVESRFNPRAVSPKGAQGLGQLMPATASMLGVRNAMDVSQNIYGTSRYLRMQYDRWQKSDRALDFMLASYNAGPNSVEKYKGIPPYRETQDYVKKVKRLYHFFVYGS